MKIRRHSGMPGAEGEGTHNESRNDSMRKRNAIRNLVKIFWNTAARIELAGNDNLAN